MVSYHDLIRAFQSLGFHREIPVLAHLGKDLSEGITGGMPTFMGALLSTVDNVMLPAFTYSTMVVPQTGPEDNDLDYGNKDEQNAHAQIFSRTLPSESGNQDAIDILKSFPGTLRSEHPIFSFYGLGMDIVLLDHTPEQPYRPIREVEKLDGWILLANDNAAQNFSVHTAEMLAGRSQFTRWALTPKGIASCPHYPGCPNGFHKLDYYLHDELHQETLNGIFLQTICLRTLIKTAVSLLKEDPFALLCNDLNCSRCNLVRKKTKAQIAGQWQPEKVDD